MDICVVGTGYVGLVAGTCLADMGHRVVCVDRDARKIEVLQNGGVPIYEPGLEHLVARNIGNERLSFTTDGGEAIRGAEVVFIAVGTPSADDGSADLSGVLAVADQVGRSMSGPMTVVVKSTVPVGTADRVREAIAQHGTHAFDVVSNPEFLKEGAAIDDFTHPDRIVVGFAKPETRKVVEDLYAPLLRTGKPILYMDNRSAELAKYVSNAFLATKISFINEIARLCEVVGADVDQVRKGAGSDSRIGTRFFFPGIGYGGSCFPKDVKALSHTAEAAGSPLRILEVVEAVNVSQKRLLAEKVLERFGKDLQGRRFAVWGLAFKPQTDDMRQAPSLVIIEELLSAGAEIVAFDPEAMAEARAEFGDRIRYSEGATVAADGCDALLLLTEWNAFRRPDWEDIGPRMKHRIVFDGRNIYSRQELELLGFEYHCVGRPHIKVEGDDSDQPN
ncbi:MAG: UDP-glucose/GDP-mannose dehydrogenase family protein [Myxococcota bacterium]|nr:UDP-glucose/GDP-mannose dehydrogenase family protein [Myxococcota bacterium]